MSWFKNKIKDKMIRKCCLSAYYNTILYIYVWIKCVYLWHYFALHNNTFTPLLSQTYTYCMSDKSCPTLSSKLLHKIDQDFLDIQYILSAFPKKILWGLFFLKHFSNIFSFSLLFVNPFFSSFLSSKKAACSHGNYTRR